MKKIYIIFSFILVLMISFLGITYSYEYNENEYLKFELIGDYVLNLELGSEYYEYGARVIYNGTDISNSLNIDSSMVDMNVVGEYKVKYMVEIDNTYEYIYRVVKVRENIKPEIILKGDSVIYVSLGDKYIEPGYIVSDNHDMDIDKRVNITSYLDASKLGEYQIIYKVVDSSGNMNSVIRTVIVR